MQQRYIYENCIAFAAATRSLQINTENEDAAQSMARFLNAADGVARLEHGRNSDVEYKVNISDNLVIITSERNNLDDVVAALNDLNSLGYITKAKRENLVIQVDKVEDTPERRAKIKADFIAYMKARRKQQQQEMSVGNGSQLLIQPVKHSSSVPASTNGHHQNGNASITSPKPVSK